MSSSDASVSRSIYYDPLVHKEDTSTDRHQSRHTQHVHTTVTVLASFVPMVCLFGRDVTLGDPNPALDALDPYLQHAYTRFLYHVEVIRSIQELISNTGGGQIDKEPHTVQSYMIRLPHDVGYMVVSYTDYVDPLAELSIADQIRTIGRETTGKRRRATHHSVVVRSTTETLVAQRVVGRMLNPKGPKDMFKPVTESHQASGLLDNMACNRLKYILRMQRDTGSIEQLLGCGGQSLVNSTSAGHFTHLLSLYNSLHLLETYLATSNEFGSTAERVLADCYNHMQYRIPAAVLDDFDDGSDSDSQHEDDNGHRRVRPDSIHVPFDFRGIARRAEPAASMPAPREHMAALMHIGSVGTNWHPIRSDDVDAVLFIIPPGCVLGESVVPVVQSAAPVDPMGRMGRVIQIQLKTKSIMVDDFGDLRGRRFDARDVSVIFPTDEQVECVRPGMYDNIQYVTRVMRTRPRSVATMSEFVQNVSDALLRVSQRERVRVQLASLDPGEHGSVHVHLARGDYASVSFLYMMRCMFEYLSDPAISFSPMPAMFVDFIAHLHLVGGSPNEMFVLSGRTSIGKSTALDAVAHMSPLARTPDAFAESGTALILSSWQGGLVQMDDGLCKGDDRGRGGDHAKGGARYLVSPKMRDRMQVYLSHSYGWSGGSVKDGKPSTISTRRFSAHANLHVITNLSDTLLPPAMRARSTSHHVPTPVLSAKDKIPMAIANMRGSGEMASAHSQFQDAMKLCIGRSMEHRELVDASVVPPHGWVAAGHVYSALFKEYVDVVDSTPCRYPTLFSDVGAAVLRRMPMLNAGAASLQLRSLFWTLHSTDLVNHMRVPHPGRPGSFITVDDLDGRGGDALLHYVVALHNVVSPVCALYSALAVLRLSSSDVRHYTLMLLKTIMVSKLTTVPTTPSYVRTSQGVQANNKRRKVDRHFCADLCAASELPTVTVYKHDFASESFGLFASPALLRHEGLDADVAVLRSSLAEKHWIHVAPALPTDRNPSVDAFVVTPDVLANYTGCVSTDEHVVLAFLVDTIRVAWGQYPHSNVCMFDDDVTRVRHEFKEFNVFRAERVVWRADAKHPDKYPTFAYIDMTSLVKACGPAGFLKDKRMCDRVMPFLSMLYLLHTDDDTRVFTAQHVFSDTDPADLPVVYFECDVRALIRVLNASDGTGWMDDAISASNIQHIVGFDPTHNILLPTVDASSACALRSDLYTDLTAHRDTPFELTSTKLHTSRHVHDGRLTCPVSSGTSDDMINATQVAYDVPLFATEYNTRLRKYACLTQMDI